jgi:hypothetical protein
VSTVYSKYIAAAMAVKEEHAQAGSAHIRARDRSPVVPLFEPSPIATDHIKPRTDCEIRAGLVEQAYAERIERQAGVTGRALWYSQVVEGKARGITDAEDAALQRLDAKAERQARYRAAQGGPARRPGVTRFRSYTLKIDEELYERAKALAALRGQGVVDTMNFLLDAGLTLVDERTKRYEAYVIDNLLRLTTEANAERAALAVLHKEPVPEPERFLDPESKTLRQAYQMVYPLEGAPPTLARLAMEYPAS